MRRVAIAGLALVALTGCSVDPFGDDEAPGTTAVAAEEVPGGTYVIADPFCREMVAIRDLALAGDALPVDELIERYETLRPEVPEALTSDFDAMLAELRGDRPVDTAPADTVVAGVGVSGEEYLPDDSPQARVIDYVASNCLGTLNNPGPQATAPP